MDSGAPLGLLQGVRILSFTQFLLGPAGVQYLADMGGGRDQDRAAWWEALRAQLGGV